MKGVKPYIPKANRDIYYGWHECCPLNPLLKLSLEWTVLGRGPVGGEEEQMRS